MASEPLNPRKEPLQARARLTHETILQGATQLLSTHGLDGFNTNAVAERAGTSVASVYQYFPNKHALMLALIHRQKRRMLDDIDRAMESAPRSDLEMAVRLLIRAVMKHTRDDPALAAAIDEEEARLPIAEVITDYLQRGGALCVQFLQKCCDLPGMDPSRAARTLPAMISAIMDHWPATSPTDLDTAEDEAVEAVTGYLKAQIRSIDR